MEMDRRFPIFLNEIPIYTLRDGHACVAFHGVELYVPMCTFIASSMRAQKLIAEWQAGQAPVVPIGAKK